MGGGGGDRQRGLRAWETWPGGAYLGITGFVLNTTKSWDRYFFRIILTWTFVHIVFSILISQYLYKLSKSILLDFSDKEIQQLFFLHPCRWRLNWMALLLRLGIHWWARYTRGVQTGKSRSRWTHGAVELLLYLICNSLHVLQFAFFSKCPEWSRTDA